MIRYARLGVVVGLLVATVTAFGVAERLKLEESPIGRPRVDEVFSPVCTRCGGAVASISFRLRRASRLAIAIVDSDGEVVRRLIDAQRFARGPVDLVWNGRDDSGRVVEEGVYRPRLRFVGSGRTIVLRTEMRVDTTRPKIELVSVRPRTISPDGDGRGDGVAIRYRLDEPGRALLYVNGEQRVRGRARERLEAQIEWYGKVGREPLPTGRYRLEVAAEDLAQNRSRAVRAGKIRIRYVTLGSTIVRVRAGRTFRIQVDTDANSYRWRLGSRMGVARGRVLRLRARRAGRFVLLVTASGHSARALVEVSRPRPPRRAGTRAQSPSAATRGTRSGRRG